MSLYTSNGQKFSGGSFFFIDDASIITSNVTCDLVRHWNSRESCSAASYYYRFIQKTGETKSHFTGAHVEAFKCFVWPTAQNSKNIEEEEEKQQLPSEFGVLFNKWLKQLIVTNYVSVIYEGSFVPV